MTSTTQAIVLKHRWPTRLFHSILIVSFLPAACTGMMLWGRHFLPPSIMHTVMQVHIVCAAILSLDCLIFLLTQPNRIAAFWNEIFTWTRNDLNWFKICGGYPQKILLRKEVPVPPMRKINSGQKILGILVFFGTITLITTGAILYIALPLVPKEIAWYADRIHLIVGIVLTLCIVCAHIPLSIYNWHEIRCMFGDGTMPVDVAKHHNPLWIAEDIQPVQAPHKQ